MKQWILAFGILSAMAVTVLFLTWRHTREEIQLYNDDHLMRQEILRKIPQGSSIKQAQVIMEKNGFACSGIKNGSFAESTSEKGNYKYHKGINFLSCEKKKSGFLSNRRWQIAIVDKNNRVSEVLVSVNTTTL